MRENLVREELENGKEEALPQRNSLKPSTAELGLEPRPTASTSPQRLGKSLKSFPAERWGRDTAGLWQPDQPDEC